VRQRIGMSAIFLAAVAVAVGVAAASAGSVRHTRAAENVSLKFTSLANSPAIEAAWKDLIDAFQKRNPGVTITRTSVPYANYRTVIKLHASGSDAPDLVEGDMGPGGVMASLVGPGLLLPLDKYATQYGWQKKFGKYAKQLRLSGGGKIVGSGPMYGVPDFAEMLGVFVNRSLLAKLHRGIPKTFADFEASLEAAKGAGITPLVIGGLDKWPWSHFYDLLADHFGRPAQLIRWFNGDKSATIVTPALIKAATVLQQWVKAGYFEDGANGVSDGDAVARFSQGKSLYKVDGPWAAAGYRKALGRKLGFFLLPAAKAGVMPASTGWMGWDVGITTKSKNQAAAASFLNFLTSNQARTIIMRYENPPGTPGVALGVVGNPVLKTIVDRYSTLISNGTLVPYMDVAYPQAAPHDMLANVQAMAAGKMSPSDFLKSSQEGWAAYHGYAK
jgi:raffinose/stachyose/melibiose transport system substrate-binding protein